LYSGPKALYDQHEETLKKLGPVGTIYLDEDHGNYPHVTENRCPSATLSPRFPDTALPCASPAKHRGET
ncbi:hypothetical protein ACWGIT_21545, partial [Streptomyces cyaneofuscatus]